MARPITDKHAFEVNAADWARLGVRPWEGWVGSYARWVEGKPR